MKNNKQTELVAVETDVTTPLDKPRSDTEFATASAKLLVDIVNKNGWSRTFGGQSKHLQYEAWQTVGKYYGYTVKTGETEYVEMGGTWGFKAKATVINENTGIEVGSAEAYCMNDEGNWKNKPKFQLASMAQTRAGSKSLRQILGFVVALAGYNPTPAEEMDGVHPTSQLVKKEKPMMETQNQMIKALIIDKGKTKEDLDEFADKAFKKDGYEDLSYDQASFMIHRLQQLPDVNDEPEDDFPSVDEIDQGIEEMRKGK